MPSVSEDGVTRPAVPAIVGEPSVFAGARDRPVFVGACPRSGTTLLRTMLNSHPELALPLETRFLMEAWEARASFGDLSDADRRRQLARWIFRRKRTRWHRLGVDQRPAIARLVSAPPTIGSLLGTCFLMYAEHHGKPRWGDKRPMYDQHLDAIFAMFPDAQFVHLVRDPRATVASVRRVGWSGGDVVAPTELWGRSLRAVDAWRGRLAPDQLLEIRYEDLVIEPRATMERVCGFLGLAPEGIDSMLAFHERGDVPQNRHHWQVSRPVTAASVRGWEKTLDAPEVAFVERALGAQMRRYGYPFEADGVRVPDELRRAFLRRRCMRTAIRARDAARETALSLTYRRPVAARLTSGQRAAD
ncbi:MAG: sulfotransferase [Streptosporangiales bacterium]|nr:sulfotransferase [Streptosporangiales bacterium]